MTKTNFLKGKMKTLLILLLTCVFSLSLVFAIACDEDDTTVKYDPSFTYTDYTQSTTALITNGDFTSGLAEKTAKDFPVSSINSWNVGADTNSDASILTNGVVLTTDDGWKELMGTFYGVSNFKSWAEEKFNSGNKIDSKEDFQTIMTGANGIKNPKKADSSMADDKVLMLANFVNPTNTDGRGTAMKASSTSTITLEKGKMAKISVWVNTTSIYSNYADFGANVRVLATVNGIQQATYTVKNIQTNGVWKQINILVKGNEYLDTTIAVTLGLGMGSTPRTVDEFCEGFAFFDGVTAEVEDTFTGADAISYKGASFSSEPFNGNEDFYKVNYDSAVDTYGYSLNFNEQLGSSLTDVAISGGPITFNETAYGYAYATNNYSVNATSDEYVITLENSAIHVNITSSAFVVPNESYVLLNFKLKNELSAYDKSGIKLFIVDKFGASVNKPSDAIITNETISEDFVEYTVLVKNNFVDGADREFELILTVGTEKPLEQTTNKAYYPTGTITLSDVRFMSGALDSEDRAFNFLSSLADTAENNVSYALYAGYSADYAKPNDDTEYPFSISFVNKHNVNTEIVNPSQYLGVTADHAYVKADATNTAINTNDNAGVISSAGTYANAEILTKLGDFAGEKIYPLMINVNDGKSYGFIGEKLTTSASAYTKISVKVKVTDNAVAYVYLVDMSKENKLNVLTQTFNGNYDKYNANYENELVVKVTADTANKYADPNGWVEVSILFATGKDAIDYRIELWNGERDRATADTTKNGYVFFEGLKTGSFTESQTTYAEKVGDNNAINQAYTTTVNGTQVLTDADLTANGILYKQELTDLEVKYNAEEGGKISYPAKYVYVDNKLEDESKTFVYAIFNSINPVETDPYASSEEETEEEDTGCTAKVDSATFWLQFSSILLAVVLVFAMIMLLVKTLRRRHTKKKKVRSRYSVTSRNKTVKANKEKAEKKTLDTLMSDETANEDSEEQTAEEETEYTYGEVLEDFSDEVEIDGKTIELPVEETEETSNEEDKGE